MMQQKPAGRRAPKPPALPPDHPCYGCNYGMGRRCVGVCYNRCGGLTFELPKKWVKISPPRALSEAQKRVLDEMNQRNRERRQSA